MQPVKCIVVVRSFDVCAGVRGGRGRGGKGEASCCLFYNNMLAYFLPVGCKRYINCSLWFTM